MWLTPCYYALQCRVSTPCACTQSVKLMDTRVTDGQKRRKQSWLARAYEPHRRRCWWCAMLCVLVCGCDLLKPAPARQTAEPPAVTRAAPNSNQVAAPSPPPAATTATPTSPTPQPLAVRTAIVDPPPAPALNPAPRAQPAKNNQNLLVPDVQAKVQTSHTVTNSVAKTPTPQTTVTYIPREAAAAIVIKGPPRPPEPPWSRIAVPLCLGMGLGAGLVALVFSAKRRFRVPSVRKARKDELFLPSEFKLRDSAIQPEAPFGMLAPEKPVRRSKIKLLVSVLASTPNAIRFLVSKLPMERIGTTCRAGWQRISASVPAIPEQRSSTPLSSSAEDSKRGEISAIVASPENGVQSKLTESPPFPPSANSGVPASPPVATPMLDEPLSVSEVAGEAVRAPREPSREASVPVT
jgi:hypothetical protein